MLNRNSADNRWIYVCNDFSLPTYPGTGMRAIWYILLPSFCPLLSWPWRGGVTTFFFTTPPPPTAVLYVLQSYRPITMSLNIVIPVFFIYIYIYTYGNCISKFVSKTRYIHRTGRISSLSFGTRPYPRHNGKPQLVAYLSHTFHGRGRGAR